MCTSIKWLNNHHFYFGRTLDNPVHFGEKIVFTLKNYSFWFTYEPTLYHHFAMIGMARVENKDYPLYADGMNEYGLCMASLYFPHFGQYSKFEENKINLPPYELISYILLQCKSVEEAKKILQKCNIVDTPFNHLPLPVLHWIISDEKETIVIEPIMGKLEIYENPFDVLTNSPPFPYHLENICNYLNLTPRYPINNFIKSISLNPYGSGIGTMFLPGDFSPSSRFVKTAFLIHNSISIPNKMEAISHFFQILSSVSMLKGAVYTKENLIDYTLYTCCMDTQEKIYYYKTYENTQINAIKMLPQNYYTNQPIIYDLIHESYIHYQEY